MTNVSIAGCGWLGLPLATFLVKKGYQVSGSTTSREKLELLSQHGIKPFLINFYEKLEAGDDFFNTDILIVLLPPAQKRQKGEDYLAALRYLVQRTTPETKLLYTSSTSIYKPSLVPLSEDVIKTVEDSNYPLLYEAEKIFLESGRLSAVVRLGGLTGYDRILIKYFAGKRDLTFGSEPVNLIHRDDAVQIVYELLKQEKWNGIFNACAPKHPLKRDFYTFLANTYKYELPHFAALQGSDGSDSKIVSPERLISELSYRFLFPDPYGFTY
jgi:nucleoside-diphosphate-sugar epimerase